MTFQKINTSKNQFVTKFYWTGFNWSSGSREKKSDQKNKFCCHFLKTSFYKVFTGLVFDWSSGSREKFEFF
jgi:hypothetical protein